MVTQEADIFRGQVRDFAKRYALTKSELSRETGVSSATIMRVFYADIGYHVSRRTQGYLASFMENYASTHKPAASKEFLKNKVKEYLAVEGNSYRTLEKETGVNAAVLCRLVTQNRCSKSLQRKLTAFWDYSLKGRPWDAV